MSSKPSSPARRSRSDGSILLLVLVVISVLTVGTATYLRLMQNEHRTVRQLGRLRQARALAESGVTYLQVYLAQTPQEIFLQGDLYNNPDWMQAVLVTEGQVDFERGRFSIIAPALNATGDYAGYRFGVEDESAKLNVNSLLVGSDASSSVDTASGQGGAPADRLSFLPGMTPEIADAILDWLDEDDSPRTSGAESETYQALDPPYSPRNGPIADLDELLLVRGVTPELLYGLDQNRNFQVDADELPRGLLAETDGVGAALPRGWSALLTTFSVERFQTPDGVRQTNLNMGDMQRLYTELSQSLGEEQAKFIVLYRQFGGANGQGDDATDSQSGGGGRSSAAADPSARGAIRGGAAQGQPMPAAAVEIDFQRQPQAQIGSLLDLVGVTVEVPNDDEESQSGGGNSRSQRGGGEDEDSGARGGAGRGGAGRGGPGSGDDGDESGQSNNEPPTIVASPWQDDPSSYRELLSAYDLCAPGNLRRVAGRVNVNTASRSVLLTVPGIDATIADQILARRELPIDPVAGERRHAIWLLTEGLVSREQMSLLEPYLTAAGHVYRCQIAGFFDAGTAVARLSVVLDCTGQNVRIVDLRNLSPFGPGFSPAQLGAVAEQLP